MKQEIKISINSSAEKLTMAIIRTTKAFQDLADALEKQLLLQDKIRLGVGLGFKKHIYGTKRFFILDYWQTLRLYRVISIRCFITKVFSKT